MRILVNGDPRDLAESNLERALEELGFGGAVVATALNGEFVSAASRASTVLAEGDRLEVLAPMQGG
ncbi:MAG: sulfur carrier protein ThiS [Steroidobacteraceae bacterium]|jgi:sulfur carrier protein|nr:sulfur carrier protein ThiS [Steroidobacteraceae bacterium]